MFNKNVLLPGLPKALIEACYAAAPGNEIESGKFGSKASSAALAANTFGYFLDRPGELPPLPGQKQWKPPVRVCLEGIVRFPWRGGRHPCLDALVQTPTSLIGVEAKRYEPYRARKKGSLSDAYWRPVWGRTMRRFEKVRDKLRSGEVSFKHLDATQLIKHAFGLRSAVHADRDGEDRKGKAPKLIYLYAEPEHWPDGRPVKKADIAAHRDEIDKFTAVVAGDEVEFVVCRYRDLLSSWQASGEKGIRDHAIAVSRWAAAVGGL